MREYRMADIIGTARERFSDYGELAALESWERSQLIRVGVNELTTGIAVIPGERGLELMSGAVAIKAAVEIPPPPIVPLKAPSLLRR